MTSAPPLYPNPWRLIVAIDFGQTAALGSSVGLINLLMPRIMTEISADVQSIQWVQTSFLLTMVILLPAVGWLGAAVGQRRLYLFSLGAFCLTTFMCTLAWDLPSLIFFRILQAIGAGLFFPLGTPFIFEAFPPRRRGLAMGTSILIQSITSLTGSLLASHLADLFGWRWGFYYLSAMALIGLLMSIPVIKDRAIARAGRFDLPGCLSLALALISLLLLITDKSQSGFFTPQTLSLLAIFLTSTAAFFIIETKTAAPFVDLRLYRYPVYAAGSFIGFLLPASTIGVSFLLPIYLQGMLGYSVFQTSILYMPSSLSGTVFTPLAGWLSDRVDARLLVSSGLIGAVLAIASLSTITPETTPFSLVLILAQLHISTAFVFTPMSNTMYSSLPQDSVRLASGLYALKRQLGRSLGGAAIGVLFASRFGAHHNHLLDNWAQPQSAARAAQESLSAGLRDIGSPTPGSSARAIIEDLLWENATLSAFSDCFLSVSAVLALTLIPIIFLRRQSAETKDAG